MIVDIEQFLNEDCLERSSTLNLNASENHMSMNAKKILTFPAYDCYDFPPCNGKILGLWKFSSECHHEKLTRFIAKEVNYFLGTNRIDMRPRGGQSAEISVLLGLADRGDQVFYVSESSGGHFGLNYIAIKCGIVMCEVVFNDASHLMNIELTLKKMSKVWGKKSNKLLLLNQSFILQTQPWKEIVRVFKKKYPDMIISCDVSHLLGLILGSKLENPLKYGVDIIHGSTHKSFPGPQKAMIFFHSELDSSYEHKIMEAVSPGLQSSSGTAEMMSLAYVFCEMKKYASKYARDVCRNARLIAESLVDFGVNVSGCQFHYTETHQVWLPMSSENHAWEVFSKLHQIGIRVLPGWLPFENKWGIRIGTNALTRRGLVAHDFIMIAKWISQVIKREGCSQIIKSDVREMAQSYPLTKLKYTLAKDEIPHILKTVI